MPLEFEKIVTVIPARGGSKSLPMKNIMMLNDKPLIQYSIDYSLASELVWKTVVSTDSEEIAEVSRKLGAEVPFIRPDDLAEDLTPDYPVFYHALRKLEELYETRIDILVLLRPTSPLRPDRLIEQSIDLLKKYPDATSVRSVTKIKQHPYRSWIVEDTYIYGYEKSVNEPYNLPRQLLPPVFYQTGDIETMRRETILSGSISGEKVVPLIIQPEDMVDIDNIEDMRLAEDKLLNG